MQTFTEDSTEKPTTMQTFTEDSTEKPTTMQTFTEESTEKPTTTQTSTETPTERPVESSTAFTEETESTALPTAPTSTVALRIFKGKVAIVDGYIWSDDLLNMDLKDTADFKLMLEAMLGAVFTSLPGYRDLEITSF
ncbi:hypothetical protein EGW08_005553, partial [Elysia chlorotica]